MSDQFWEDLNLEMEKIGPTSLAAHLDPTRPYDGQPHTDYGIRGATQIEGLTFRDLRDCFIRACYESSGLSIDEWPGGVYQLPWSEMDIIAVAQNLSCNVEKFMGIYPNIPPRVCSTLAPTEPHWCGPRIDSAVWLRHDGEACST